MPKPLKYEISNWHQAVACHSNLTPDYKLEVCDFVDCSNENELIGTRITLKHPKYGVLFTAVLNTSGTLVSNDLNVIEKSLSDKSVTDELKKWGFDITFVAEKSLTKDQVNLLTSLKYFNYDKIRILNVKDGKTDVIVPHIVAFNITTSSNWVNPNYVSSTSEFTNALLNGKAFDLKEPIEKIRKDWSWLRDKIADIDETLQVVDHE